MCVWVGVNHVWNKLQPLYTTGNLARTDLLMNADRMPQYQVSLAYF